MSEILISCAYGGPWSAGEDKPEAAKMMLTWPALIKAVKDGENIDKDHPAVKSLENALRAKFPKAFFYFGGANDLTVIEVDEPFSVQEYDGFEYLVTQSDLISLP